MASGPPRELYPIPTPSVLEDFFPRASNPMGHSPDKTRIHLRDCMTEGHDLGRAIYVACIGWLVLFIGIATSDFEFRSRARLPDPD